MSATSERRCATCGHEVVDHVSAHGGYCEVGGCPCKRFTEERRREQRRRRDTGIRPGCEADEEGGEGCICTRVDGDRRRPVPEPSDIERENAAESLQEIRDAYAKLPEAPWFKSVYEGASLGESIPEESAGVGLAVGEEGVASSDWPDVDKVSRWPEVREAVDAGYDRGCDVCGGKRVTIRGRHPGCEDRVVCPTCLADRIEVAIHILNPPHPMAAQLLPRTEASRPSTDGGSPR